MANESIKYLKQIADSNKMIVGILKKDGTSKGKGKPKSPLTSAAGGNSISSGSREPSVNLRDVAKLIKNLNRMKGTKGADAFAASSTKLISSIKEFKSIEQDIPALQAVGDAILSLATGLKKSAFVLFAIAPITPVINYTIKSIAMTYAFIGRKSKRIRKGTRAMTRIGKSLVFIAAGIALTALTLATIIAISPVLLLAIPAIVGGLALTYAIVGSVAKRIDKGAIAMGLIGISLVAVALGIAMFTEGLKVANENLQGENVISSTLKVLMIVGGAAALYWVAGKAFGSIAKGALAFFAIGLSLAALGWGIGLIMDNIPDWDSVIKLGVVIGSLTAVWIVAGLAIVPIALGAAAMGVLGISLIAIGLGLKATFWAIKDINTDDAEKFGEIIGGLGTTFAWLGLKSPFILLGSAAGVVMGAAMASLGLGLKTYMALSGTFDNDAFATLTEGLDEGFSNLGLMSGPRAMVGIMLGAALMSIAGGVGAFANLEKIPNITGWDKDGNPIYGGGHSNITSAIENIKKVLSVDDKGNSILSPFITFGDAFKVPPGEKSLMSALIGGDFGRTPAERGIKAALDIGDVLQGIGGGIATFANLQNMRVVTEYNTDGTAKSYGKADIGKATQNMSSALKAVITALNGVSIPEDMAVTGLGDLISGIASGVSTFANTSAVKVITGYDEKTGKPIYGTETVNLDTAAEGIIRIMGTILNGLATLTDDLDMDDINEIATAAGSVISKIVKPFVSVSADMKDDIKFGELAQDMSVGIQHLMFPFSKKYPKDRQVQSYFVKQVDDISGILKDLSKIQKPFDKFATSFDKFAVSMGTFATNFNSIDVAKNLSFADWTRTFMDFSELDIDEFQGNLEAAAANFNLSIDKSRENMQASSKQVVDNASASDANAQSQAATNAALLNEIIAMKGEITSLNSVLSSGLEVEVVNVVRTEVYE